MFMRLLQAKIKPGQLSQMRQLYDEQIIPELQKISGCLYACLMQNTRLEDEVISMTMWETERDAKAYEQSGVYGMLRKKAEPVLSESSEWSIELSENLELQYKPSPDELVVKAYHITTPADTGALPQKKSGPFFVRLTTLKIKPDKITEFKQLYTKEILPTLLSVKGCRYAYLTEGVEDNSEMVSVTIWDSKEDAQAYERGGLFQQLVEKSKDKFSQLFQWKIDMSEESRQRVVTSEDLTVTTYTFVTGKSLKD